MAELLLEIDGLTIRFGEAEVVSGLSLRLERGEILALVGESGSGKSLTALAVLGLLPETAQLEGAIRFEGKPAGRGLRGRRIGAVFQDPGAALDPVFPIGAQLDEALRAHPAGLSRGARRREAIRLLGEVGIPDPARRLGDYPHQFSGGQLQRVMIAIALAAGPDLLIADEPTTALDVAVQQEILDLLLELNHARGISVLLITHDMGVVADIANRVAVMRRGRLVEVAGLQALFRAPAAGYTRALLAAVPKPSGFRAPLEAQDAGPVLQLEKVSAGYKRPFRPLQQILDGVSLTIAPGETLGLVGESGSGKSTTGRLIAGLLPRLSGEIRLVGERLESLGRRQIARRLGMVFQNPGGTLNPRLSIAESIAEPLLTHARLSARARAERVAELLEAVALPPEFAGRYPAALSGGQRQRVAIARAIALDPALLIADEPTSALDVSVQAGILELLHRLQAERGLAMLFISHDLNVVRQLCHRVLVMQAGRIVESGPVAQVFEAGQDAYTRRLIASAPVADPEIQWRRRQARLGGRRGEIPAIGEERARA